MATSALLGRLCRDLVTPTTPLHRVTGSAVQHVKACAGRDGQKMSQMSRDGLKGLSTHHTPTGLGMWQSVHIDHAR